MTLEEMYSGTVKYVTVKKMVWDSRVGIGDYVDEHVLVSLKPGTPEGFR